MFYDPIHFNQPAGISFKSVKPKINLFCYKIGLVCLWSMVFADVLSVDSMLSAMSLVHNRVIKMPVIHLQQSNKVKPNFPRSLNSHVR